MAIKWKDKRDVNILSIIHNDTSVEIPGRHSAIQKPACVEDYNLYTGVDFNDQMLQPYLATKRSRFWNKKVATYLIHLAIYNAIYSKYNEKPTPFLKFIEEIVMSLIY